MNALSPFRRNLRPQNDSTSKRPERTLTRTKGIAIVVSLATYLEQMESLNSGPGGRRFKSSLSDHSFDLYPFSKSGLLESRKLTH